MAQKQVLTVVVHGYERYMLSLEDALRLVDIAARMVCVDRRDYTGPYVRKEEQEPLVTGTDMVWFEDAPMGAPVIEPAPQPVDPI